MFWQRFYGLCLRNGKKPNPVGREIGLSSGIISKWKAGGIPNGETLMKLSKYFNVSTDYLLGLSNNIEISEQEIQPYLPDKELKKSIVKSCEKLNSNGLAHLEEYAAYLSSTDRYCIKQIITEENDSEN